MALEPDIGARNPVSNRDLDGDWRQETGFLGKIMAVEPDIGARNPVSNIVVGKSCVSWRLTASLNPTRNFRKTSALLH